MCFGESGCSLGMVKGVTEINFRKLATSYAVAPNSMECNIQQHHTQWTPA